MARWPSRASRLGLDQQVAELPHRTGGLSGPATGQRADQRLDPVAERRSRGHGDPLVGQGRAADAPAVPGLTDHGIVGHEDVGQEDLVEHGGAGELAQGPDVDALGVHVDDEVGDAGVLGRVGVGPGQADPEVGRLGQRRPDLLAVEEPAALDLVGPGAQRGQVRPGAGLAEELAPGELAQQGRPDPALLLLVGAVGDDRGQGPGPDGQVRPRDAGGRQLLVDDQLVQGVGRPGPTGPASAA